MKKEYITPALRLSGMEMNPYLIIISGEDAGNGGYRKSKKLNTFEDEIESEETDFWH